MNNHIFPFLWLKGESQEIIADYIRQIHESHIGAICIESRPHPDFLGPKWWADVEMIIAELKKYNMKLWILDDAHFPTGYAGGAIKQNPRLGKKLLIHRRIQILGPKKQAGIYTLIPGDENARLLGIVAKQGTSQIDLSGQKENPILYFDLPEGLWQVFLIYESTKASYNPDYINMTDPASCRLLIDAVYESHYQHFKDEFGRTIVGFFSDEPGFGNEKGVKNDSAIGKDMPLPWSHPLKERLKARLGEDYLTKLTALWQKEPDSPYIRHVYMDECTRLYDQCFSSQIGTWCREHGVEYIGHIIEDRDSHARLGVGPGHFFRSMYGQDMAGIDVVLNQLIPGIDQSFHPTFKGGWDSEFFHYALVKLGTSLAHIDPKKKGRTMAEVFGAYGWCEGVSMMKWITDHFLVRGVNHFVPHAFSMARYPDSDCPPHFYAHKRNPLFPYFGYLMNYMNHMCSIFSGGITLTDVAVLYHGDSEWAGDYMPVQKPAKELTRSQIEFDIIPADVFTENEYFSYTFSHNRLTVNTQQYKGLVIPYCQYISKELYQFVKSHKDFPIIFLEDFPMGLYNSRETITFQDIDHAACIPAAQLAPWLKAHGLAGIHTESPCPSLRIHRYQKEDAPYIMAFNEDPVRQLHSRLPLTDPDPGSILRLDLMSDSLTPASVCGNMLSIDLEPYESCVYILGSTPDRQPKPPVVYDQTLMTITSAADLSLYDYNTKTFSSAGPLKELCNLSAPSCYPDYSGIFAYEIPFTLDQPGPVQIHLGEVHDAATLFLDQEKIGMRICPPYRFCLNHVNQGPHTLRVEVANTLDKHHMDLISSAQEISPSGLLGPVTIKIPSSRGE